MTAYDVADLATYGAHPVELYRFDGAVNVFYTNAQEDIVWGADTFTVNQITSEGLKFSDDISQMVVSITLPETDVMAQQFFTGAPAAKTQVTMWRHLLGIDEFRMVWQGMIVSADFDADHMCILRSEPMLRALSRNGCRRMYQVICPYPLYGYGCFVTKENYRTRTTVTAISGNNITVASTGGRSMVNGEIHYGSQIRMVTGQNGLVLQVIGGGVGLKVGDEVSLFPGCDKSMNTCRGVFGNITNWGGFPNIPNTNPWTGDSLINK